MIYLSRKFSKQTYDSTQIVKKNIPNTTVLIIQVLIFSVSPDVSCSSSFSCPDSWQLLVPSPHLLGGGQCHPRFELLVPPTHHRGRQARTHHQTGQPAGRAGQTAESR